MVNYWVGGTTVAGYVDMPCKMASVAAVNHIPEPTNSWTCPGMSDREGRGRRASLTSQKASLRSARARSCVLPPAAVSSQRGRGLVGIQRHSV